jgi:hypothetical protein
MERMAGNIGARPISKIASRPRNDDNGARGFNGPERIPF